MDSVQKAWLDGRIDYDDQRIPAWFRAAAESLREKKLRERAVANVNRS